MNFFRPVLTAMFTTITHSRSPRRGNLGEMCHLDVVVGAISTCPHNIHVCSTRIPCGVLSYFSWNQQLRCRATSNCVQTRYRPGHGRPHGGPPNNLHQGKHTCTHLKDKTQQKGQESTALKYGGCIEKGLSLAYWHRVFRRLCLKVEKNFSGIPIILPPSKST